MNKSNVIKRKRIDPEQSSVALHKLYATTFQGLEGVLAKELSDLGAQHVKPSVRGVSFRGTLDTLYKANLWSRTANRI
ncbi:MAG: hypothetical protein JXR91_15895, partial [Deltaproteobacteria bacterium]|nr:hypothetical protein [Deltaproteobacteria bacterium]